MFYSWIFVYNSYVYNLWYERLHLISACDRHQRGVGGYLVPKPTPVRNSQQTAPSRTVCRQSRLLERRQTFPNWRKRRVFFTKTWQRVYPIFLINTLTLGSGLLILDRWDLALTAQAVDQKHTELILGDQGYEIRSTPRKVKVLRWFNHHIRQSLPSWGFD